jgi:HKD family nuclease
MIIGSQNLSKSAYLESVENLTVIENIEVYGSF